MRQHARSILQLPARLTAETRLQDVQAQVPGFVSEVQERMKSKAQRAWQDYERALETNPMRTKALTSCVGLTVADLIAQAAEGGAWDVARTGRMASFGLFWHGLSVRAPGPTASTSILSRVHGLQSTGIVSVRAGSSQNPYTLAYYRLTRPMSVHSYRYCTGSICTESK